MSAASRPLALFLLLLLASVVSLLSATTLTCPEGQTLSGERCYKVYRPSPNCPTDFNFTAAQQFCEANDGQLASIHSAEQQAFITGLIKKAQKAAAKRNKCGCHPQQKDYAYWIGLELERAPNGSVSGASWTDNSPVNYGNPLSASFRPPFAAGAPEGSAGDGSDSSEVCPPGNAKNCVQVIGFGSKSVGAWTDKNCSDQHEQVVSCSCDEEQPSGNSTAVLNRKSSSSSSSSAGGDDEGVEVNQCQLDAALNGFICQYCPQGWTPFQGQCYKAIAGGGGVPAQTAACNDLGATVVSIHSQAENVFVTNLALDAGIGSAALIGLQLTHNSNAFNAPPTSASWSDGTPVDYGNPLVAPWSAQGVYPWSHVDGLYPPQPDNRPPPADCVIMWMPGANHDDQLGSWDDIDCPDISAGGVVCKL